MQRSLRIDEMDYGSERSRMCTEARQILRTVAVSVSSEGNRNI